MFDFGERLRSLRESRHMSQEALGKKVNKSKSVISSYENNLKIPPVDILVDFAVLYHVSLDYLVGLERRDSISIDGLTERQVDLISTILLEFRNPENAGNRGLTPRQVNILSNLLIEFARPDV